MEQPQTNYKVYPGWLMVLTGFMAMAVIYPVGISLMSLFIEPIGRTFEVSQTAVSLQFSLITFSSMAGSILSGSLLNKFGLKKTMVSASFIVLISFIGLGFSPSIWVNYLISIIIGLTSPALTNVGISVMINTWFGQRLSGNAIGIAMIGSGVGAMILTPVVAGIINTSTYTWRAAYIFIAVLILILYIPLVILFVKDSPQSQNIQKIGLEDSGDSIDGVTERPDYGLKFSQVKSHPIFYLVALTFMVISFVSLLFYTLSFNYFTTIGYDAGFASTLLSIQALALIFGKYGMGLLSDKTNPYISSIVASLIQAAGLVCILFMNYSQALGILGMILFGIGNALGTIAIPLITQAVFGNINYGQIVGIMSMFGGLGAAIGPVLSTYLLRISNSYNIPWSIAAFGMVVVTLFILMIKRTSDNLEEERRQSVNLDQTV